MNDIYGPVVVLSKEFVRKKIVDAQR